MTEDNSPRSYLIFTGTGPILVLSTYPELTDDQQRHVVDTVVDAVRG